MQAGNHKISRSEIECQWLQNERQLLNTLAQLPMVIIRLVSQWILGDGSTSTVFRSPLYTWNVWSRLHGRMAEVMMSQLTHIH